LTLLVGWLEGHLSGGLVLACICLERGADLHMAQLMPLPLTVSCSSKIQIGFTFVVLTHPGSPGHRAVNECVCVSTNPSKKLPVMEALISTATLDPDPT